MDIIKEYAIFCGARYIPFNIESSVLSYDDSTLFCPAGMQKYKGNFRDLNIKNKTIANIQPCIRLNDLDSLGDGTHLPYFNMIGLFSFRHWDIKQAFYFWWEFMHHLGFKESQIKIHIHGDKLVEWDDKFMKPLSIEVDNSCKWTDGEIGGYCTEFYYKNIEIGNIVNPLGDCIDAGFGFERIDQIINGAPPKDKIESLISIINVLIQSNIKPSNTKHGYVLRRLLRSLYKEGGSINHDFFKNEIERQEKIKLKYDKLKDKYPNATKEYWFDTHGIDLDLIK